MTPKGCPETVFNDQKTDMTWLLGQTRRPLPLKGEVRPLLHTVHLCWQVKASQPTGTDLTDDLGSNTEDLNDLGHPHPSALSESGVESAVQKTGRRFGGIGLSLTFGPIVSLLVHLVVNRASMADDVNMVLAICAFIVFETAGIMFIGLFFVERIQRYPRAMLRQVMKLDQARADQVDQLIATAQLGAQKMAAVEKAIEAVPGYGEGVIHGVQMRADALGPDAR